MHALLLVSLLAAEPDRSAGLRDAVCPAATEDLWATIPWGIDLWAARERAAKEGKPILLWEMDGHPLGCT